VRVPTLRKWRNYGHPNKARGRPESLPKAR
jgi:hypothetical protein